MDKILSPLSDTKIGVNTSNHVELFVVLWEKMRFYAFEGYYSCDENMCGLRADP